MSVPDLPAAPEAAAAPATSRRRVAPIVALVVAAVLAGLFWVLAASDTGPVDKVGLVDSPQIGRAAPSVRGTTLDGDPFDLSRRKGSWVVLNFFTHNCVPCIREHPELVEFVDQQRALGTTGAELYTIVRDSTREQVDEFFAERGGDWPIVYDPDYEFSNGFGVTLVPETWIIDPNGFVRARFISEVTAEGLGSLLNDMRGAAAQ